MSTGAPQQSGGSTAPQGTGSANLQPVKPGGAEPRGGDARPLRVLVGLVLGLGLGLGVAWNLLAKAQEVEQREREQRRALVSLRALADLARRAGGSGEGVRAVVNAWADQLPLGSSVRVIAFSGLRLEASTFPEDKGERAAPRRLSREEKPLYDRGQRLRAAIETNREEGTARKLEVEAEDLPGGGQLVSAPVEVEGAVVGMVEMATPPGPQAKRPGLGAPLGAFFGPLVLCVLAAFLVRRQALLVGLASVLLVGGFGFYANASLRALDKDIHNTQEAVAAQLRSMTTRAAKVLESQGLPAEPAFQPGSWDADAYRRPLGLLTSAGELDSAAIASRVQAAQGRASKALALLGLLALGLFLFVGLGGASNLVETLVEHRQAYAYIFPAMAGMLLLVLFPFAYGITLSFTDSNLYNVNESLMDILVGLRNYGDILGDFNIARRNAEGALVFNYANFYYTLFFTVVWTVTNVAISVTIGLVLALILNIPNLAFRPIYRVVLIFPWAMPSYITALIWKGMFHQQFGVVNHVLRMFGGEGLSWFDSPFTSYLTALATNVWLGFPFMMVVALGALQSIPADLYEAARVDGASRWQQFISITLPSLRPALVPAVILSVVWTFNQFNVIFLVNDGQPGGSTEILVTQAYKYAFQQYRYGYAAAYSTIIFGILLLYSLVQNRLSRATEAV